MPQASKEVDVAHEWSALLTWPHGHPSAWDHMHSVLIA